MNPAPTPVKSMCSRPGRLCFQVPFLLLVLLLLLLFVILLFPPCARRPRPHPPCRPPPRAALGLQQLRGLHVNMTSQILYWQLSKNLSLHTYIFQLQIYIYIYANIQIHMHTYVAGLYIIVEASKLEHHRPPAPRKGAKGNHHKSYDILRVPSQLEKVKLSWLPWLARMEQVEPFIPWWLESGVGAILE